MPATREATRDRLVRPRGHVIRHSKIERVDDGTGEPWFRQWTPLLAHVLIFENDELNEGEPIWSSDLAHSCGLCDEKVKLELLDDGSVTTTTDCKYSNGITSVVEINVPSGKLVVADSLRDVYDPRCDWPIYASYGTVLGQHQVVVENARLGCAYGAVGNSCPGIYELSPGSYVIANPEMDWDADDEVPLSLGGKQVASICTDLWAYSLADHDDYVSKGGDVEYADGVIEIPAGRYRLTHHTGEKDFMGDTSGEVVFAHFERAGDAYPQWLGAEVKS